MKTLEFFAHGIPKAQPRVRAVKRGKHVGVFTPGSADEWKFCIQSAFLRHWDKVPFTGPVRVDAVFFFQRPKSHYRANGKLCDSAPMFHTSKPDRDNADKCGLDSLTAAGAFADDCFVCDGRIRKTWTGCQGFRDVGSVNPGALIRISEVVE